MLIRRQTPSLAEQLSNAGRAAGRAIAAVAQLKPLQVSDEVRQQRAELCGSCAELLGDWRCGACGCFTPAKVRMTTEQCPKGRW